MLCTRLFQLPEQNVRVPKKTGFYRAIDFNGNVTYIPTIVGGSIATTRWIANALFNSFSDWFSSPFHIVTRIKPPECSTWLSRRMIYVSPVVFLRYGRNYSFYMKNESPVSSTFTTDGNTFYTSNVTFDGSEIRASIGTNRNNQTLKLRSDNASVYASAAPAGTRDSVISLCVGFAYVEGTGFIYWDFDSDLKETYIMRGSQLYWRWK